MMAQAYILVSDLHCFLHHTDFHCRVQEVEIVDEYVSKKHGTSHYDIQYKHPVTGYIDRGTWFSHTTVFLQKTDALKAKKRVYQDHVRTAIHKIHMMRLWNAKKQFTEAEGDAMKPKSLKEFKLKNRNHLQHLIQTNTHWREFLPPQDII